ncbi:MAG: hypothetical protein LBM69_01555 [Lachnospiraceae bacterium]|jgi:hypothetical protein|nr:hypothetical protein [Lachnospiraceae bacterium]
MTESIHKSVELLEMLPESEQDFVYEFIKRLVLAWDPDYTKTTSIERKRLEEADLNISKGECFNDDDVFTPIKTRSQHQLDAIKAFISDNFGENELSSQDYDELESGKYKFKMSERELDL